jgi:hypothetical protein
MFLRISSAGLTLLALAACGPESAPPDGELVECAIGVSAEFAAVCTLEHAIEDAREVMIVHHPDGGFRRFAFGGDGVLALDGAGRVEIREPVTGDVIEFAVENDRYRLPFDADPGV